MESQDFGLTNDEKVASAELGVESLEIRPENAEVLEESVAEEEVAIQDHSPNSEVSDKNSEEPAEIEDVSFEEYLNNVADFRKVSIEEVRRSFENDQLEHTLYFGRGTCYHCRVFSPELKIFNQLIDGNLEYYDIDGADFGEEAKDFLFRVVGIPGTPALLRMYNGKPLAAWVGGGITAQ
ncbi:thioredoxin family protein [Streptococcus sp. 121]|nr:thioredoxin family protein [Streptococcus sp. 121]